MIVNSKIKKNVAEQNALLVQYDEANNSDTATQLGAEISDLSSDIDKSILIRNILYGTAGAATIGLTLTFVF